MKLCFVGWGDHIHLERWAGYFAENGHDVSIISFTEKGRYPERVRQYRLGFGKRGIKWREIHLGLLLRMVKPDIVHVHWAHFAHPVTRVWKGPLAITAWGSDIYRESEQTPEIRQNLRVSLGIADIITCDSQDLAERIEQLAGGTRNTVEVIQWGVDTKTFFPAPPSASWVAEIGAGPVIFSARNFTPLYNQDIVVDAFAKIQRVFPKAQLLMKYHNGDAAYLEKIKSQIQDLGLSQAVKIFDSVPYEQMADFYRASAITLSIPHSDATPMALLEAMACGSVPVFSNLPSIREWIYDGKNGLLVHHNDANMLADRITHLLSQPEICAEFRKINLGIVETRASQSVNMQSMENIYNTLKAGGFKRQV